VRLPVRDRPTDPDRLLLRRAARSVAVWTALAVAVLVFTMIGVALIVEEQQQHQQAEQISRTAWRSADDVSDPPAQTWLVVIDASGRRQVSPGAPAAVSGVDPTSLPDGSVRLVRGGRELVVYTGARNIGRVSAVHDLSLRELEEQRLKLSLAVAGLIGIAGAAGVGALIGRRAVRPLGAALALQRRFVTDASHELRTPLSVLLLRAQLLRRHLGPSVPPDRVVELERLVEDTKALGDVVTDLLLSVELQYRPDGGTAVNLAELAVDVVESMHPLAARQSVELLTGPAPSGESARPPTVNGAAAALRRALASLVDNAIAHTPPGGHVAVTVTVTGAWVTVVVTDDGEGLDPTQTRRLIERFFRGAQTGDGRRFGLGLALVHEVAQAHGGSLAIDGESGAGAAFTLTFPAASAPL
jgi:signal transduction histidine kinase